MWQKVAFRTGSILFVMSLILVIFLVIWHLNDKSQLEARARDNARAQAVQAAGQIDVKLRNLSTIAQTLADEITDGTLPDDKVEAQLIMELEANDSVGAVTAAYAPDFVPDFAPNGSLYSPYSSRKEDNTLEIIHIENEYDYTMPDNSPGPDGTTLRTLWYSEPLQQQALVWSEPYLGASTLQYWAGVGVPFYRADPSTQERIPAGVVDASLTLDQFQELVAKVDLGETGSGYGFILSQTGKFISHPIDEFVTDERDISDLGDFPSIEELRKTMPDPESKEPIVPVLIDHIDERSGQSFWVFLAPIASPGWWVGIALDRSKFLGNRDIQRHRQQQVWISIATLALLSFLSVLLFRAYRGGTRGLWAVSGTFTVLSFTAIAYMWFLNITALGGGDDRDITLVERASSVKVVDDFARGITNPIYVPTGVFVQSVEFSSANNVDVTGYIWQKYSTDIPEERRGVIPDPPSPGFGLTPGFILPESDSTDVSEVYRLETDDWTTIGWYFHAVLRQEFDYAKYPFDRENVWIRIWHKDFDREVILTPDLLAYTTTNPTEQPGLEKQDFVLEGWDITQSFFSYRENSYNTNLGNPNFGSTDSATTFPELYFNLGLKRNFINTFISNLIPIIVVALLLFAVLITMTSRQEGAQLSGFSTSAVLSFAALLFFVVIVSHLNLRSSLAAQGLIYLESFYFVMYAAILTISINAILIAAPVNIGFIDYRDNLIARLLYWPVILGLLLVITIFAFV